MTNEVWKAGWFGERFIRYMKRRKPDVVIGTNYLNRWHVLPRNRFFNVYFHEFIGSDPGRDAHDHPWWSLSYCLRGIYVERDRFDAGRYVRAGMWALRRPKHAHRILVDPRMPVYTIFITGPRVRDWGFHTKDGWIQWETYGLLNGGGVQDE